MMRSAPAAARRSRLSGFTPAWPGLRPRPADRHAADRLHRLRLDHAIAEAQQVFAGNVEVAEDAGEGGGLRERRVAALRGEEPLVEEAGQPEQLRLVNDV